MTTPTDGVGTMGVQLESMGVQPFRVTVVRDGCTFEFDVRGTHGMLVRLCEWIDVGEGRWGEEFGALRYREGEPVNGLPAEYDYRDTADDRGAEPVCVWKVMQRRSCPMCGRFLPVVASVGVCGICNGE